jgi:uncharacterized protein (TIGR02099 family)
LLAHPRVRLSLRIAGGAVVVAYFAVGLLVLVLRHSVLPGIEHYRGDIERMLSTGLARPVAIRAIDARWQGWWPNLRIHGLEIRDAEGRPALGFDEVEADLAWSSLWHLRPHFARLEIDAPSLDLRRDPRGRLFVAGLELSNDDPSGDDFSDWLLAQDRIVIRNATITWHDELRGAPPLALAQLNVDLRNGGSRHRFGVTAQPPRELASRLDIRGDFRGRDLDQLDLWRGEIYLDLEHVDLAGWRAWLDYPIALPRGSGGLRLWLGVDRREPMYLTADVRLKDVSMRLAPDLPPLVLDRLDGRLAGRRLADGYSFEAKQLSLASRDKVEIAPTDLEFSWHPGTGTRPAHGRATANGLDLGALGALAGHLPLDAGTRGQLKSYRPQGRLGDLRLSWSGEGEQLGAYSLKTRFEDLGLAARGVLPGFSGLDGYLEADEKGGRLQLDSRDAMVELPAVFPEPRMTLAVLEAQADWKIDGGAVEAQLRRARFENSDAAGEASGRYRGNGHEPGWIDLSASLGRASGGAVWRYMPSVVNKETRDWLRNSIVGGAATATLRLKGDLQRFPFSDGSGIFEVKGPYHGAALNYASGWPAFDEVAGDLEFVGARMTIRAKRAKLWGVALADVKAEIADLGANEELMTITGLARGPTADFLRFIEASPVGERIDHFTEDMRATGNGELRLRLDMPLRRITDTRVDGRYRFLGNGLVYDQDMPPLGDINGELHFTGDRLDAQHIRAAMLGAPMSLDVTTEDGRVAVKAAGNISVRGLRQQYVHPVFDHLSGTTPWSGTVRVKKRAAEVRIESSLQGISSSLPAPFNKTAGDTLPLVFERKPPPENLAPIKGRRPATAKSPADRDMIGVSLGDALRVQLIRRHEDGKAAVERGMVAVGRGDWWLPERGVMLAVRAQRLDGDFWRRLLGSGNGDDRGGGLPLTQMDLRADELVLFDRSIEAVQAAGNFDGGIWKLDLKSRQASGNIEWNGSGAGRLNGHLSQLVIADSPEPAAQAVRTDAAERLPSIGLTIDRVLFHGRDLGEVRLKADNRDGDWLAHFEAKSDDGQLEANGRWRTTQPPAIPSHTSVAFKLTANSAERMLARLGYPEVVRRGSATLDGQLSWAGPPTGIDYASLAGKLKLEAASGQFNKLEPGVGRLLGIVSLQSLPRRISLDFRDIFSEGFAFDNIAGQLTVDRGIMETRDFQIQGPAAKVLMHGRVNLAAETQDLKVRVQPSVGETVATGVLLVHPVAGAAAWVMNKLFGSPLDKAFAFDYAVTGSWADPTVSKLAAQGPAAGSPGSSPLQPTGKGSHD